MPSYPPPRAELAPGLSVAGKLDRDDIEALAKAGVRTIVNNRPDDEDPGQLPAAEARRLAEAHGIAYHHIPVTAASLSRADVEAFAAVLGSAPDSGLFPFDKFSSAPFLIDAVRNDAAVDTAEGDVSRRIFVVPRTQVLRLHRTGSTVTSLDLVTDGTPDTMTIPARCAVVLANGTIEATRIALDSLGIGNTTTGSPPPIWPTGPPTWPLSLPSQPAPPPTTAPSLRSVRCRPPT